MSTIHDAFTGRDRSGGIDLVRCLGVIAVVAGHVWETPQSRAWLYPWHVPVFFFLTGYTPLSMGSALTCFAFIAAGACCRAVRGPAPRRTDLPLGILLVAAGIAGFVFGWLAPLNLKSGNFGTPLLSAIAACAISFGMVLVCEWIALRVSLLDRLAQHVAPWALFIVFAHPAVLWATSGMSSLPLRFTLALCIPALVAAFMHRTALAPWLLGSKAAAMPHPSAAAVV